jgi:hypothetical protein
LQLLSSSQENITTTHNGAQTLNNLIVHIRSREDLDEVPEIAVAIFQSFGIEGRTASTTPVGWEATVKKNVEIIQDALLFAVSTFRRTIPEPPPHKAQWPQDFDDAERKELQRFLRAEMTKIDGAFKHELSAGDVDALCEQLRSLALPLKKANHRVIRRVVVQLRAEKRSQGNKIEKRRKRKSDEMENDEETRLEDYDEQE